MSFLARTFSVLVALIISIIAGAVFSFSPEKETDGPLLIALSFICEEPKSAIEVAYLDNNCQTLMGRFKSENPSFNSNTFEFPAEPTLDSLTIKIESEAPVHITGLRINCGAYHLTMFPESIISEGEIESDHFLIDQMNQLVVVPDHGSISIVFPEQICLNKDSAVTSIAEKGWDEVFVTTIVGCLGVGSGQIIWNWFWLVFWSITAIQFLLILWFEPTLVVKAQMVSVLFSIISCYVLVQMVEDVKNATLTISLDEPLVNDTASFELYYGLNGVVLRDYFVSTQQLQQSQDPVSLTFPSSVHRHFRLDLPSNDSLVISSVLLYCWPVSIELRGYDIVRFFPELNDLNYQVNENEALVITTGKSDPYLYFSKDDFQDEWVIYQQKREHYPYLVVFLFYLILLLSTLFIRNIEHSIFLIAIALIILLPNVTFIFKQTVNTLYTEKRQAAQLPTQWDDLRDLTRKTSKYLNDQFGGRASLITGWNVLNVLVFGQTGNGTAVVFGEEDWMFYQAEGVKELFENKTPMSEEQMKRMTDVLEERRQWLASYGIDYYVTFPPLKHTVYEEYLPSDLRKWQPISKLDMFGKYLRSNSKMKYIDLKEPLFDAKEKESEPIYFKYDSHWNMKGAYYAYSEIHARIEADHSEVGAKMNQEDFRWEMEYSPEGDLAKLISMNTYYVRSELFATPIKGYRAETVESVDYPSRVGRRAALTMEVQDSILPTLLVDRDSYSNYLIPYLSEHFSRSVYVWSPLFSAEIIKEELPDIVITQMTERSFQDVQLANPELVTTELDSLNNLKPKAEIVGTQR